MFSTGCSLTAQTQPHWGSTSQQVHAFFLRKELQQLSFWLTRHVCTLLLGLQPATSAGYAQVRVILNQKHQAGLP